MDFLSWSSTLLKLNGYDGNQQQQQQAGLLPSSWPWISDPTNAARPALLLLDLAVLEAAAAANHFWQPTSTSSLAMANFMSSRIMDKQHQLSFGIDRILGNQVGAHRSTVFTQVPTHVWSGADHERDSISVAQRQEISIVEKQVREIRQGQMQQQNAIDQQQTVSNNSRRKRSWSRAVFSNLQRKGLEKRFQLQKYITKPDRRQLAAALQLTDAQVKVWFQNRRMKWRHNKEPHLTNEMSCNSPVEHCTDVAENLCCMDDSGNTAHHVPLPKSHPTRFHTFKKA